MSQNISFNIVAPTDLPVGVVGQAYNCVLQITITGLPAGLTAAATSIAIQGTPTAAGSGNATLTVVPQ